MSYWLQKFFSNVKIQRQLFLIYFLAFSLPILVIGLFLVFNTHRTMRNQYLEQTEAENLRVKSILFDVTTNIYNISEDFSEDELLRELLSKTYTSNTERSRYIDSYRLVNTTMAKNASIATIKIYTTNKSVMNYGSFQYVTDEIRESDWYQKALHSANSFWITKHRIDQWNTKYSELTMYRKIPLISMNDFALLEITISGNYLKNRIDNNSLKNIISVNQDAVFYSSNRALNGSSLPTEIDYSLPYYKENGTIPIDEEKYIASISTFQPYRSNDQVYILSFSEEALPYISRITKTYTWIVILALFLPCFLIYIFSKYFSARVNILRSAMNQASRGDYDIIDSFHGNDEISETFQDLIVMIDEIKRKESMMYQAEIKEQKIQNQQQQMEFKMLASQINPHFLYNTLETIRMKAFTSNNKEVATAIKLLGKSLRYVLENTGIASTTLDKELAYIETYLKIQRLRFEDRVNYSLTIEDNIDLSEYSILPLLLQPIVENAIIHGLEGVESNGQIHIHIYIEDQNYLIIRIKDNGIGMDQSRLKYVQEKIKTRDTSRTTSIGLYNINQRIALCYGSKYSMDIHSLKGNGTSVILRLPLDEIK